MREVKKQNYILSPTGTSILTHKVDQEIRALLNKFTNEKSKESIPDTERDSLQEWINQAKEKLEKASIDEAMTISAELNGIIKFYGGKLEDGKNDHHILLCTDTWLGDEAAKIVQGWLQKNGLIVELKRQVDLQTAHLEAFQLALSELVKWCAEIVDPYKNSYHIVFNLTGGFKSVQGFLQTLAGFYADETVYVFESGKELLRIPRLLTKLSLDDILGEHFNTFRKLALGFDVDDVSSIPETLLMSSDGKHTLSPWGELAWDRGKEVLYGKQLWPTPTDRIRFGKNFQNSLDNLAPNRLVLINKRIDQLARHFLNNQYNPNSLEFKPIKGKLISGSTHEFYAWSDQDAKRVFGHYENDIFVLDSLGKHL